MVGASENRVELNILNQGISEAAVPLIVQSKTALGNCSGLLRPVGSILSRENRPRTLFLRHRAQRAEKCHSLQVFIAAVDVRHPLAVCLAIVQVQQLGQIRQLQAVDVVFLQPENSTGDQEIADLRAFKVKVKAPVRLVERLSRIVRFIKPCAVESAQSVQVSAEMRGIPVENDADPLLVKRIDKVPEVLAAPIAGGRRKERLRS